MGHSSTPCAMILGRGIHRCRDGIETIVVTFYRFLRLANAFDAARETRIRGAYRFRVRFVDFYVCTWLSSGNFLAGKSQNKLCGSKIGGDLCCFLSGCYCRVRIPLPQFARRVYPATLTHCKTHRRVAGRLKGAFVGVWETRKISTHRMSASSIIAFDDPGGGR